MTGLSPVAPTAERPLCALPADDPWMETMLRPIVESAGYRVVASGTPEAEAAEILILADGEPDLGGGSARIVRLRSDPQPADKEDDSIHRYDRAALIGALARARGGKKGRA